MWNIERRDHKSKQWERVGEAADLKAAADMILKKEDDQSGALFLSSYVDPYSDFGGKDDVEILSRFEHRADKWLYTVTRKLQ